MNLLEIKLNALSPAGKLSDLETAAGGQGINLGRREKNSHHIDYPDAVHKKSGKKARTQDNKVIGGSATGDKSSSKMTKGTHQKKLKDAVVAGHKPKVNQKLAASRGRVDKRPAAKAKRKAEAAANKEKKSQNRDPFKRQKTFEEFMAGCLISD